MLLSSSFLPLLPLSTPNAIPGLAGALLGLATPKSPSPGRPAPKPAPLDGPSGTLPMAPGLPAKLAFAAVGLPRESDCGLKFSPKFTNGLSVDLF